MYYEIGSTMYSVTCPNYQIKRKTKSQWTKCETVSIEVQIGPVTAILLGLKTIDLSPSPLHSPFSFPLFSPSYTLLLLTLPPDQGARIVNARIEWQGMTLLILYIEAGGTVVTVKRERVRRYCNSFTICTWMITFISKKLHQKMPTPPFIGKILDWTTILQR